MKLAMVTVVLFFVLCSCLSSVIAVIPGILPITTRVTSVLMRQNVLTDENIKKIIETYKYRKEEERYSRRVSLKEIERDNDFNLNISRYVSTAVPEPEIDLEAVHGTLADLEKKISKAAKKHNEFLKELGLSELP